METDPFWMLNGEERLEADDLSVWRLPWPKAKHAIHSINGVPNPVLHDGLVVVSYFAPGAIRAVDAKTGELRWHQDIPKYSISEPLVARGLVAAQGYSGLYALDLETGRAVWQAHLRNVGELSMSLALADNLVILGDSWGTVFAYDLVSGRRRWRHTLSRASNRRVNGKAISVDDCLIVANNAGWAYGLDSLSGKVRWRTRLHEIVYATGFTLNGLAVVRSDASVFGLHPHTGAIEYVWRPNNRHINALTVMEGSVFASLEERESIPVDSGINGMRYQPQTMVCVRDGLIAWESSCPPFPIPRLGVSAETDLVYEATLQGLGLTDSKTGVRRWVISNFHHKDHLPDDKVAIPWVTRDRIYALTSDGSIVCMRHP